MLALAHDGVEQVLGQRLLQPGAVGADPAVRGPGGDEVRGLAEVPGRVDVPVLAGDDEVVAVVAGEQVGDVGGDLPATGHRQAAVLAEVDLDVDDEQGAGHAVSSSRWADQGGVAGGEQAGVVRQLGERGGAARPGGVEVLGRGQQPLQGAGAGRRLLPVEQQQLVGHPPVGVVGPPGGLAPAEALLARRPLGHRRERAVVVVPDRHELVDEAGRGRAGPGHHARADAVAGGRRVGERGDRVLVEVAGDDDPGVGRAELVEQGARPVDLLVQVAAVEPDRAEARPRHLDGGADALLGVVGVDEQRGADALGSHLRREGLALAAVREGEGVGTGPHGGDAVPPAGLQVARRAEPGDVRRPGRGDGGLLVGAPAAHLQQGAGLSRRRRAASVIRAAALATAVSWLRTDRTRVSSRSPWPKVPTTVRTGLPGRVGLALRVRQHLGRRAVRLQPGQRRVGDDARAGRPARPGRARRQPAAGPAGPGPASDAEAPARRQPPGEHLEDGPPVGEPLGDGGVEHRQLVPVGQQGGRHRTSSSG